MPVGPLIIVAGPTASGKTSLVARALEEFGPRLRHSVSATTRAKRPGEVDGIHYHFWTRERFEKEVAAGAFLEFATVHGKDFYGTPRSEVEPYRAAGTGVILDIDVQGAEQLRRLSPDALTVFVEAPPGEYERRLRARGTESEEAIRRRLETAQRELARAHEFDRRILNDDLDRATAELCDAIRPLLTDGQQGR